MGEAIIVPILLRPREVKPLGQDHMAQPPYCPAPLGLQPPGLVFSGPKPSASVAVVTLGIVSALAIQLVQSWAGKASPCVT